MGRRQFLWEVLVSVCEIALNDGSRPSIEEWHLFQVPCLTLIPDTPSQLKDAQAKPLKKRFAGRRIDIQERHGTCGICPWIILNHDLGYVLLHS